MGKTETESKTEKGAAGRRKDNKKANERGGKETRSVGVDSAVIYSHILLLFNKNIGIFPESK